MSKELYFGESVLVERVSLKPNSTGHEGSMAPVEVRAHAATTSIRFDAQGKFAPYVGERLDIEVCRRTREDPQPQSDLPPAPPTIEGGCCHEPHKVFIDDKLRVINHDGTVKEAEEEIESE